MHELGGVVPTDEVCPFRQLHVLVVNLIHHEYFHLVKRISGDKNRKVN